MDVADNRSTSVLTMLNERQLSTNNLPDATSRFVVVMHCVPGQPMLIYVDDDELERRRDRRAPRQ
ncbi:hypothetical protein [Catellatospora paridis]|uniref:hypothetical protein n=1 Tax=Catellatospora paridis TaxID=1617086 RepID=UPI001E3AD131|nr:hypothetical protein [Catellatospora paridis]